MKWNDANCALKMGFICEKVNNGSLAKTQEVVLPLSFSYSNGDPCPEGYSTFGCEFKNLRIYIYIYL